MSLPTFNPDPKVKCLLVDDMQENLDALSVLLERSDIEILTATSGPAALELLLANDDIALALLDVQMPAMDGFELAELIRGTERTRHIPLIFVTAGARDQSRLFKGYDTGAVDFLFKPVEPHVLRNKADVFFQLHRQKQQLARQLRERTETLRLNETFTAVLGHDLRNPLAAILMSADYLQTRLSDEPLLTAATGIGDSARRMSRMIEDVLDLARVRLAGGMPVDAVELDLKKLVQAVVQEHRASHPDRDLRLETEGDGRGRWDAGRLGQAMSNLIGNALRHGSAEAPVQVRLDGSREDVVLLSVTNAGSIPPEVMPHLFDPFRSGARAAGRSGGLGLGLYIVQQVVLAHGGELSVITDVPGQTGFQFSVPRQR